MIGKVSLRNALGEAFRFAAVAWRRAPIGCGLIFVALVLPAVLSSLTVPAWLALVIALFQAALALFGWTSLLRAAIPAPSDPAAQGRSAAGLLASIFLCSLFVCLIIMVLGLVLLGIAGATGLSQGDDLTMTTQAAVAVGGWQAWILLALQIASVLIVLTLMARLMPAGPMTIVEGRVISLQALSLTRGSGLKPALGLLVVLAPFWLLSLGALMAPEAGPWIDWLWAGVLAFIQWPLLAGYSVGLWRTTQSGVS